mgnify:CR=1 FL=1
MLYNRMVKLRQGSNVLESELNQYFDYDNNFPQLLEDYLRSGDMEFKFNHAKTDNKGRFISNRRSYLKGLYEQRLDSRETKLFKIWMTNKYQTKVSQIEANKPHVEISDKDKLIEELQNENIKLKKEICQLKNKVNEPIPIREVKSLEQESIYDLQLNSPLDPLDSPIVEAEELKADTDEEKQFIENRKATYLTKKELKDAAYQLEIDYLNSFNNDLDKEFPSLVNDFSQGELDIEEVKEELEIVYNNKLNNLKDPLVNIIRLRNKTKIHIQYLMGEFENL